MKSVSDGLNVITPRRLHAAAADHFDEGPKEEEEDKLSEEGSRWIWTQDSNVRENHFAFLVSRDPVANANAATICLQAEPESGVRRSCSSQPSLSSTRPRALVFSWSLITLISWSRPHKKQMSMSHEGKISFQKRIKLLEMPVF